MRFNTADGRYGLSQIKVWKYGTFEKTENYIN